MSTIIMSQCWPLQMSPTQKSVLVSLADNANDEGVCWPSVPKIAMRTCLSERAVQSAVRSLIELGYLVSMERAGRSSIYTVNPTPAADAPPHVIHPTPAGGSPHPRSSCTPPPQLLHPEPSLNRH